jgi:hypothetical protein
VEDDIETPPIVLVASSRLRISGIVGSAAGPVSGARVTAAPVGVPYMGVRSVTTDAQGRFSVFLPPDAREADFRVEALGFAFRMLRLAIPSNRMVNLLVDQQAGTLVIEKGVPIDYSDPGGPRIFLIRAGAVEGVEAFERWAVVTGVVQDDPARAVVPLVEPGEYRACWVSGTERQALELGALPSGPCASGSLAANGELTLRPKPPKP